MFNFDFFIPGDVRCDASLLFEESEWVPSLSCAAEVGYFEQGVVGEYGDSPFHPGGLMDGDEKTPRGKKFVGGLLHQ